MDKMEKKLILPDTNLCGVNGLLTVYSTKVLEEQGYSILPYYGKPVEGIKQTVKVIFPDGVTRKNLDKDDNIDSYQVPTWIQQV